jgi:hypothetical protein
MELDLSFNQIGDAGMTAFAGAICASAALPSLQTLHVNVRPPRD